MRHLATIISTTISLHLAACGPRPEAEEPTGHETGTDDEKATGKVITVEFRGVAYGVEAKPVAMDGGHGVKVTVTPTILDGADHAFVHDIVTETGAATSLRFDAEREGNDLSESSYTAGMHLEVCTPGDTTTFERTYPDAGGEPVAAGETVALTVGILGTEDAGGGQRYAPDLARVTMTVGEGEQVIEVEPLDPAAHMPVDFISWEIGSHKLVIKPFYPLKQNGKAASGESVAVYEVGSIVVRIKGSELVVNDLYYGKIESQQGILVDHGKVTVGGEDITGEPIEKKDLVTYHAVEESKHELAGYEILVSPGASKFGTFSVGDTHRIVLDGREVVIDEGVLSVDGVCYGEVKPKSKIKIFFDEISVGKKKLVPVPGNDDAPTP